MMMKRKFTQEIMGALLILSVTAFAQDSLFISEVTDPADDYSGRFVELYNAGSEAVDFSSFICYLSRQSNGGTSWGDLQLAGTVGPGQTFVVGGSGFEALYGFPPDQESGILIGNGDDAYCLFRAGDHDSGELHDIFGVMDMDGTGEAWEYEDSRAVRLEGVLRPSPAWNEAEWSITPANLADCDPGTHLGSPGPEPAGDFTLALADDTVNWGEPLEVPVRVSELVPEDEVISFQFDISYDTLVLEYTGVSLEGTLAEGGTVAVNDRIRGRLSVGYMNTTVITGAGDLLRVQFNALVLDTTMVSLSNAYLNNIPVPDLTPGILVIKEDSPPTAAITYSDTVNRYADTLLITASFSEEMDPEHPVLLTLEGAVSLHEANMNRLGATLYSYPYPVPRAAGEVHLSLSNGTDLYGNEVVAEPVEGATFWIIPFHPGDVDDDGVVLAYDAALALQYSVGMDPLPVLDPLPWERWRDSTANVDGEGGITAHDAGLILQFSAGIITSFSESSLKSGTAAAVGLELEDGHIVFYSYGELIGFNLDAAPPPGLLGRPVLLNEDFLSAVNISDGSFRIGLCTAHPAEDGEAFMKIPCYGEGPVTLNMMVNTEERALELDVMSGVSGRDENRIHLYPNPACEWLFVEGLRGPSQVRIFHILGQQLLRSRLYGESAKIDIGSLDPGVYIVAIESGSGTLTRRFIKR